MDAMVANALPNVLDALFPGSGAFPVTTTNDNTGAGIDAQSADDTTIGLPTIADPDLEGVTSTGNDGAGVMVDSQEEATVFRVKANRNFVGIDIDAGADTFVVDSDASNNDTRGIVVDSTDADEQAVVVLRVSALQNPAFGLGISAPGGGVQVTDSSFVMNGIGVIVSGIGAGMPAQVLGSIICNNTMAGLSLGTNRQLNAEGNWWGDPSGPFHAVNNPTGTGNAVVDGSSGGGAGSVDFTPWIDTVTAAATGPFIAGQPAFVEFQFSGGNGTVFLGDPTGFAIIIDVFPGKPGAQPPFTLTTDNGVLIDSDESAATVHEFITEVFTGIVRVRLRAATTGFATVTITGPCNLASAITVEVGQFHGAPLTSVGGLAVLIAALATAGVVVLRRRT
jgi:hypothetical protein